MTMDGIAMPCCEIKGKIHKKSRENRKKQGDNDENC